MSGVEFAALRNLWPLGRRSRFRLRSNRILPGPLKPLHPRKRLPAWGVSLGVVGVSVVAALAIAPQIRASVPHPTTGPSPGVAASREAPDSIRLVGTEPEAQEPSALPAEPVSPPAAPVLRSSAAEAPMPKVPSPSALSAPEPAPVQPPKHVAAAPAGFEPLPVLNIDETAFDAPQARPVEAVPRPAPKLRGNR